MVTMLRLRERLERRCDDGNRAGSVAAGMSRGLPGLSLPFQLTQTPE